MPRHRFLDGAGNWRLPRPQAAPVSANAFCACPVALMGSAGGMASAWQQVYQAALEEARAVVRPSLLERDLLGVRN